MEICDPERWQDLPLEVIERVALSSPGVWYRCALLFRAFGLGTLETFRQELARRTFYGAEWAPLYFCRCCGTGGVRLWTNCNTTHWMITPEELLCEYCMVDKNHRRALVSPRGKFKDASETTEILWFQERRSCWVPAIPAYRLPSKTLRLRTEANATSWAWWCSLSSNPFRPKDARFRKHYEAFHATPLHPEIPVLENLDVSSDSRLEGWIQKYLPRWAKNAKLPEEALRALDETRERVLRDLRLVTEEYDIRWVSACDFNGRHSTDIEAYQLGVDPFAEMFRFTDSDDMRASLDKMRFFITLQHQKGKFLAPLDLSFMAYLARNGTMYYRPRWRWYRDYTDAEGQRYQTHLWLERERKEKLADAAFPENKVLESLLRSSKLQKYEATELRRLNRRQEGWRWEAPTKAFCEDPDTHTCLYWCSNDHAFMVFGIWSGNLEEKVQAQRETCRQQGRATTVRATLDRAPKGLQALAQRAQTLLQGKKSLKCVLLFFRVEPLDQSL